MSRSDNNTRIRHNPKSSMPAVYIPCWLIQIPDSQLSLGAKMVYGRLAQWSNERGTVHRSMPQLCGELGLSLSPLKRYLKELRDVGLIGTFQIEKGGVNHFEFFDHPWMRADIHPNLSYAQPSPDRDLPPALNRPYPQPHLDPTPSPDQGSLKYKEIKRNKKKKQTNENNIEYVEVLTESVHAKKIASYAEAVLKRKSEGLH